ncbi:hypothetical protein O181_025678 [Austropuccinia psidii MF-1]|uniref:Uncharacterized protein n=1 Tax=Austropuccinia psidii MF-1 TaxID=1389203 RepID=A0A9Q3GZC1_9BASI|nr:hypothetical protein [Austropuccinia psidii MF-1]
MSSKLTELTESSPSILPPPVLCGSGILSLLCSPSISSSGNFDPSQIHDGYKEVEILDPAVTNCLKKGRKFFQHYNPCSSKFHYFFVGKKPCQRPGASLYKAGKFLWSDKDGSFGKEVPVSEAPTRDGN